MRVKRRGAWTYRGARRTNWRKFNAARTPGQPRVSWTRWNIQMQRLMAVAK